MHRMHILQRVFIKFQNRIAVFASRILMNFYRTIICKWWERRKQILLPRALAIVAKYRRSRTMHTHSHCLSFGRMRMGMRMGVLSPGSCADIYIGKQLWLLAPFIYCLRDPALLSGRPGILASLVSRHEQLINQRRPTTTALVLAADIKPEPAPRTRKKEQKKRILWANAEMVRILREAGWQNRGTQQASGQLPNESNFLPKIKDVRQ